jgi:hypothetical protein
MKPTMKLFVPLTLFILSFQSFTVAQIQPIDVAELTLKVGGVSTNELFYGFAEGDQIVFSFEELKGKPLKEIEITELPSNSKFMDFKSTSIIDQKITVYKKSVYKFSFRNTALKGRICKIKIQRIPKSEDLITFNTEWKWETLYDTTYVPYTQDSLVGYDTLHYKEKVKELINTEQIEDIVIDKSQKVHSYLNANSSYTYLRIDLPSNKKEAYREQRIIAWAYWIGVGPEATAAYAKNVQAFGDIAASVASAFGTPLAGLAVGLITDLVMPTRGEDVQYAFMDNHENASAFLAGQTYYRFDHGKGVAAYGKNTKRLQGTFYIGLHNDNNTLGIDANVKIVVVKEIKTYADIEYDRQKITPRYVTLDKKRMVVKSTKIRMNAG